ncbi:MAG: D-sedoheptulose 7-phosphate isomerase [Bacteroidetes bacterium]|nr:MAG: D-sedoheptulose 7-phosphate isomerase [Bacteroidota bacterium]
MIQESFLEMTKVLQDFSTLENFKKIEDAANLMVESVKSGQKIISAGNGGSMCDAMHFAEELTGRYKNDRPSIAAISISDPSHMSCVGNDYGFDFVFSRFLESVGQKGDVFLGISTSGNSKNIMLGLEAAKKRGIKTILLTGKDGGKMKGMADIEIVVPHFGYADRIQEIHIKIIHTFIGLIEKGLGY